VYLSPDTSTVHLVQPLVFENMGRRDTHGIEVSATWEATSSLRFQGSAATLRIDAKRPGRVETLVEPTLGIDAQNQLHLGVQWDPWRAGEIDLMAYWVDAIDVPPVDSYTRVDLRLGWRASRSIGVSVGGQNLLDRAHREYGDYEGFIASQVERSVYGKVTARF
jgi:iron complex outermembrane receptor protein